MIDIKKIFFGMMAFMVVSFAIQALSHFVINVEHFAKIEFIRPEPILGLGIATMLIQGAVLSYVYSMLSRNGSSIGKGIFFGALMGAFLVSYIAVVEPSKYMVPSIAEWMAVEGIAGLIQFILFGWVLGILYSKINN